MADKTAIQWTATYHEDGTVTPGATWNPIRGTRGAWACVKVSPACAHCYAERLNLSPRFGGRLGGELLPFLPGQDTPRLDAKVLRDPLSWQRPRKVFVCSMTDIGWELVTDGMRREMWTIMALARRHTFLPLTKRPEVLRRFLSDPALEADVRAVYESAAAQLPPWVWPLPNVWVGATVENQRFAERRIPELLATPAAVRFLSCEPLLSPITLHDEWLLGFSERHGAAIGLREVGRAIDATYAEHGHPSARLDWVIAGGESGGPMDRRLFATSERDLAWVRALRDQCEAAGIAFFWKQWGGATPKSGGRLLDGREWNEFPQVDPRRGGAVRHAVLA